MTNVKPSQREFEWSLTRGNPYRE